MMNMLHFPKLSMETIFGVGLGSVMGGFLVFMVLILFVFEFDSDFQQCQRAVPYAIVTEVRSIDDSIMCKTVEVGADKETITWLDKNGVRLNH